MATSLKLTKVKLSLANKLPIVLQKGTNHLLVASADSLAVLDPITLQVRKLLFVSDLFPSIKAKSGHPGEGVSWEVTAIGAEEGGACKVAAACGPYVAIWRPVPKIDATIKVRKWGKKDQESKEKRPQWEWKVHSSVILGADERVESIDLSGDRMLLGGTSLSLCHLDEVNGLPLWEKTSEHRWSDSPIQAKFEPSSSRSDLVAALPYNHNVVRIFKIQADRTADEQDTGPSTSTSSAVGMPHLVPLTEVWHAGPVVVFGWRPDSTRPLPTHSSYDSSPSDPPPPTDSPVLYTQMTDGILKMWSPMIDDPGSFPLWCSLDYSVKTFDNDATRPSGVKESQIGDRNAGRAVQKDAIVASWIDGRELWNLVGGYGTSISIVNEPPPIAEQSKGKEKDRAGLGLTGSNLLSTASAGLSLFRVRTRSRTQSVSSTTVPSPAPESVADSVEKKGEPVKEENDVKEAAWKTSLRETLAKAKECDWIISFFQDGTSGVSKVLNIGRKPPTCIIQRFDMINPSPTHSRSAKDIRILRKEELANLRFTQIFLYQPAPSRASKESGESTPTMTPAPHFSGEDIASEPQFVVLGKSIRGSLMSLRIPLSFVIPSTTTFDDALVNSTAFAPSASPSFFARPHAQVERVVVSSSPHSTSFTRGSTARSTDGAWFATFPNRRTQTGTDTAIPLALWQACRIDDRVWDLKTRISWKRDRRRQRDDSRSSKPKRSNRPLKAPAIVKEEGVKVGDSAIRAVAVWEGGGRVAVYTEAGELTLLEADTQNRNLFRVAASLDVPQDVILTNLVALRASPGNDGTSLLVASDDRGTAYAWHIGPDGGTRCISTHFLVSAPPTSLLFADVTAPPGAGSAPVVIAPVEEDHTAGTEGMSTTRDVFLVATAGGDLVHWTLTLEGRPGGGQLHDRLEWISSSSIRTGRRGIRLATSTANRKCAIITFKDGRDELSIWDSKESEFLSGKEFVHDFSPGDDVFKISWTTTPTQCSVLAVGFSDRVEIFSQPRMNYSLDNSKWVLLSVLRIDHLSSAPISDFLWLADGALALFSNCQTFLYNGQVIGNAGNADPADLLELVKAATSPLPDYHPQLLMQCLLIGKLSLVERILSDLCQTAATYTGRRRSLFLPSLTVEDFLGGAEEWHESRRTGQISKQDVFSALTQDPNGATDPEQDMFGKEKADRLTADLTRHPLPGLTAEEHAHLFVIRAQKRSLDANGRRYLISMRSFFIYNKTPANGVERAGTKSAPSAPPSLARLKYRDILWAFHSQSQDLLLDASRQACGERLSWTNAKSLGIFLWLKSSEALATSLEAIGRDQYTSTEDRDPEGCSIYYLALRKKRLIQGLWKQAYGHKDRNNMIKFLSNDFDQPRWKTAARKNAFALMGKQRFDFAAGMFLLGDSLQDAVGVCLRQLNDWQLAIAITRARLQW